VGVAQLERVVEVVERTMRGECVKLLGKRTLEGAALPSLNLPKVRRNPLVEIVPLSTGCLGSCTYCKTKHARGTLGSYPLDAVVGRVREAIADGVTQVRGGLWFLLLFVVSNRIYYRVETFVETYSFSPSCWAI